MDNKVLDVHGPKVVYRRLLVQTYLLVTVHDHTLVVFPVVVDGWKVANVTLPSGQGG